MRPLKLLPIALALLGALALATPAGTPTAFAGPEEGEDPIAAKIKAQMDKIIKLMEENEEAILTLSTGGKAEPKKVDVTVPPGTETKDPQAGDSSSNSTESGASAAEKLKELVNSQRKVGGQIPGELEELVRMVPL